MINNHNFFVGIFVAGLALAGFGGDAFAYITVTGSNTTIGNNTTLQNAIYSTGVSNATDGSEFKICPENHYVAQCGSYRVGFNWLKSATLPLQGNNPNERTTVKTGNYYIGDTTLELFEQMRTFFGHNGDINMECETDSDTCPNGFATSSDYRQDREIILKNLCHPASTSYKCVKCPNNANVAASVVKLDDDGLTVTESWKFYTIADCYIKEFEDQSGDFFFVPNAIVDPSELTADDGAECYYTNTDTNALSDLNGDEIGNFIPGLNSSRTLLEFNNASSEIRQFISH